MDELYREYGYIDKEGHLKLYNQDQLKERAKQLPGTNIELVIYKRQGTYSDQQRKYYFSVLVPEMVRCFKYHGMRMTREQVDDHLRDEFLCQQQYNSDTDTWDKPRRRFSLAETDITVGEFREFVDFVIIWAAQVFDWALPFPNEIFTFKDFSKSQIESLHHK